MAHRIPVLERISNSAQTDPRKSSWKIALFGWGSKPFGGCIRGVFLPRTVVRRHGRKYKSTIMPPRHPSPQNSVTISEPNNRTCRLKWLCTSNVVKSCGPRAGITPKHTRLPPGCTQVSVPKNHRRSTVNLPDLPHLLLHRAPGIIQGWLWRQQLIEREECRPQRHPQPSSVCRNKPETQQRDQHRKRHENKTIQPKLAQDSPQTLICRRNK